MPEELNADDFTEKYRALSVEQKIVFVKGILAIEKNPAFLEGWERVLGKLQELVSMQATKAA